MSKNVGIFLATVFAVIFLYTLTPQAISWFKPQAPLPEISAAPSFMLTDSSSMQFSSTALAGKIWVANFFFTSCQGPCPIQNAAIAKLAAKFKGSPDIAFASISVDPDTDTPEKLAAYAGKFNADLSRWHFLVGPKETISQLLNLGFKLGSPEEPTFHSTRLILIDRKGMIRGYYQGTDPESVSRLQEDISRLKSEADTQAEAVKS